MTIEKPMCDATGEGKELFDRLHSAFAERSSERHVKEQIQNTALSYVGQGDNRVVLLDESGEYLSARNACVVKINKYGESDANRTEFENWQRMMGEVEKYLMKITDWDRGLKWVVMPYVDTQVTDEMLKELEMAFLEGGYKIRDVNNRNCARVQDRAVMIDYDQYISKVDFDVMGMDERKHLINWKYD